MPEPAAPLARRRPTAVDLFAGAGGLSLGFEMGGFDVLAAVEYDPVHAATHLYNFPNTALLCRDVSTLSAKEIRDAARRGWDLHHPGTEWDGEIDAIIGGPSCQGFSTMGRQDADDDRNQLLLQYVRIVEDIRPKTFAMENVPGLLDERFAPLRNEAFDRLRAAGYVLTGEADVLRAEDYGVPQKRRRVIVLGSRTGAAAPAPAPTVDVPRTVAEALEALVDVDEAVDQIVDDRLSLDAAARCALDAAANDYLRDADALGDNSRWYGHPRSIDRQTVTGLRPTNHAATSAARFAVTAQGGVDRVSRLRRLHPDRPALTLRAGTGRERGAFSAARPLHPHRARVVVVREAARLHSFPDWFRFHTTNWHAHRQVGNSVPPLLAKAAAGSLLAALGVHPVKSESAPVRLGDDRLLSMAVNAASVFFDIPKTQIPQRVRSVDPAPATDAVEEFAAVYPAAS